MFCIAAFLVLLVAGAVSAKYRRYLKAATHCFTRRVTLRPCDTSFKEDTKNAILAPVAVRAPRMVKPLSALIEVLAVLLVITTIWSGYIVAKSGLNLFVYGTCEPQDAASCTLSSQVCSVGSAQPSFTDSLFSGDVIGAFSNEFAGLGKTISAIPARLRTWDAKDYLPVNVTYRSAYVKSHPTALEVIDPGCIFCKKLFANIIASGFAKTHNLTYIPFAIHTSAGYKFPNSALVTKYLEAIRLDPKETHGMTADWFLLEQIYTGHNRAGVDNQTVLNTSSPERALALVHGWLADAGYTKTQIAALDTAANGEAVAKVIRHNREIVTEQIDVVAIPTIIFGGSRHSGAVPVDQLK